MRFLALLLPAMTSIILIASGCGGGSEAPSQAPPTETTEAPAETTEELAEAGGAPTLLQGTFSAFPGHEDEYSARGAAEVVESEDGSRVLLLDDLEVDSGPALRVYLVAGTVAGDADVVDYQDLGTLQGTSGDQEYPIPEAVDLSRYRSVVIWCEEFSLGFGIAELEPS